MKKKAFTLVELLVAMLIVGILVVIALPQYKKAVEKSRAASVLPAIHALRQAVDEQILSNGSYSKEMNFIGEGHDGHNHPLSTSINCTLSGNNSCYDKYFRYNVWCAEQGCFIAVIRMSASKSDQDDYSLLSRKVLTDWNDYPKGIWESDCMAHSDVGYAVCKGIQSQGWKLSDER